MQAGGQGLPYEQKDLSIKPSTRRRQTDEAVSVVVSYAWIIIIKNSCALTRGSDAVKLLPDCQEAGGRMFQIGGLNVTNGWFSLLSFSGKGTNYLYF